MGCTPKQPCAIPVNELPCVGLEVGPFEPRAEPSGLVQMETAGGLVGGARWGWPGRLGVGSRQQPEGGHLASESGTL